MCDRPRFPVDDLQQEFLAETARRPAVLTSPTGSGKSTQVPRWCTRFGRVLVVEPRRVACIGLAAWVASLEGTALGEGVGYAVRDDRRMRADTQIVFATPGMVLQWLAHSPGLSFETAIIDEFHERSLEIDLVLALLKARFSGKLVVMSAAMNAARVADYLGGAHLTAEGTLYPVEIRYIADGETLLPSSRGLEERMVRALGAAKENPGDILVFLPGKGEINRTATAVPDAMGFEVLRMHGSLHLRDQARIFESGERRRVILATNVAETSITVPNIGTVIDSGLVKRTRYIKGRGYLTLAPIAEDSALQRAGRAGRLRAGVCLRLWNERADLLPYTEPEIYRESLTQLVLAAAACDADVRTLSFPDSPKEYAISAAVEELVALGALDENERITARGRTLFGFPLAPSLGSLLIEAKREACLSDALDLVSALASGRPLFSERHPEDPADDLRLEGCDALALIRAVRIGEPRRHCLDPAALNEARSAAKRLYRAFAAAPAAPDAAVNRRALARAALRSDPSGACIVRNRKGRIFLADGKTESSPAKESALDGIRCEAAFVFQSIAVSGGYGKDRIFAACAMPLTFRQLAENNIGEETVTAASADGLRVTAEIARVFAGAVLETRETDPEGAAAREAAAILFERGSIFKEASKRTAAALRQAALAQAAVAAPGGPALDLGAWEGQPVPTTASWVKERLESLGLACGSDLSMLTNDDLTAPPLPEATQIYLSEKFPDALQLGNVHYRVAYNFAAKEVILVQTKGPANQLPARSLLPAFRGFTVKVRRHSKVVTIR